MSADSAALLERLVAAETVSRNPCRPLQEEIAALLRGAGWEAEVIPDASGEKANLLARLGPAGPGGVLLSGHVDVVPVDGQDWTVPPFRLTRGGGRFWGRGTADMKGFVACALAMALRAPARLLRAPLRLALSFDEELGCLGVPSLIARLREEGVRPDLCLVGEPTGMVPALGHKGKVALRALCTGREMHSALAPLGVNAIHLAADLLGALRALQARLEREGARDGAYDVPFTTVHAGRIEGGTALNIVPRHCRLDFEFRNVPGDDPAALRAAIEAEAARLSAGARARAPEAGIALSELFAYPGLDTPEASPAVAWLRGLPGVAGDPVKVAFGTEGGLFAEGLGAPVVICGPGHMAQGHRPDEWVAEEQIARCDAMLAGVLDRLAGAA